MGVREPIYTWRQIADSCRHGRPGSLGRESQLADYLTGKIQGVSIHQGTTRQIFAVVNFTHVADVTTLVYQETLLVLRYK